MRAETNSGEEKGVGEVKRAKSVGAEERGREKGKRRGEGGKMGRR